MPDSNICPNCARREPIEEASCRTCGTELVKPSRGAVSFWLLGDVARADAHEVARRVGHALGIPVVVQPGQLDPRPSERMHWNGRSGTAILNQLLRRHRPGTLTHFALVEDSLVSCARENWLFGIAYAEWPSACMSLAAIGIDRPERERFFRRAKSIALHEIGHSLSLPDHRYNEVDCCMVGEIEGDSLESLDTGSCEYCPECLRTAKSRLVAFADEMSHARFLPQEGSVFASRYLLCEQVGEGGMGSVWRAQDQQLAQTVALKFVSSLRFDGGGEVLLLDEVKRARQLAHPHIVRVFDYLRDGGIGALVMDWIDGNDLHKKVQDCAQAGLPPAAIEKWGRQLGSALAATHRSGIIHQDVKPANCVITRHGDLVLVDFGTARQQEPAAGETMIFNTRGRGTPGFSAPEQLAGEPASRAHDIYAFGATLYFLLTGQPPRLRPGERGLVHQRDLIPVDVLRAQRFPAAAPVPAHWLAPLHSCLAWDPANRPESIELVAALLTTTSAPPPNAFGKLATSLFRWLKRAEA